MKKQIILVAFFSIIIFGFGFPNTGFATVKPINGIPIGLEGDPGSIAGTPIIGVPIGLEGDPGSVVITTATTDDKGQFSFANLKAGQYKLRIMPSPAQPDTSNDYYSAESTKAITTEVSGSSDVKVIIKLLTAKEKTPTKQYILTIGPKGGKISGTVNNGIVANGNSTSADTKKLDIPPILGVPIGLEGDPSAISITQTDLGVTSVGTLPTSSFYFLKEWGRGITRFFTFGSIAKAQLELTITNEKAAELLEVEKGFSPDGVNIPGANNLTALTKALQNYTNEQTRLNTQLAKLTATSTDPKVADLFKKVDEKTAKQATLLEQLTTKGNGIYDDVVWGIIKNAQNNTQKTLTATVEKDADVKQKATDEIVRAEAAISEANSALMGVSTTRGINVNPGGVDVRGSGKVDETIDEQSSIFDRWGNMIASAKSNLESAKTAFADGKYGEAYGQARSAEAMVPVLASGQNFPDKKIDASVPTTTSAETKTKLNTNTNKVPAKVLENNSPLPIERKDVPKPTSTSTESTPEKVKTSQSPVISPTSTSLVPNAKENTSESTGTPQSSASSAGPASNYDR